MCKFCDHNRAEIARLKKIIDRANQHIQDEREVLKARGCKKDRTEYFAKRWKAKYSRIVSERKARQRRLETVLSQRSSP